MICIFIFKFCNIVVINKLNRLGEYYKEISWIKIRAFRGNKDNELFKFVE